MVLAGSCSANVKHQGSKKHKRFNPSNILFIIQPNLKQYYDFKKYNIKITIKT